MIALTAGEPPLEVPRTPFALFCSSMKRKKSAKKKQVRISETYLGKRYHITFPLCHYFHFRLTMFWVCTIFHCPLGFSFGGGEWRGW